MTNQNNDDELKQKLKDLGFEPPTKEEVEHELFLMTRVWLDLDNDE